MWIRVPCRVVWGWRAVEVVGKLEMVQGGECEPYFKKHKKTRTKVIAYDWSNGAE